MTILDQLLPTPHRVEVDAIDLAAPPDRVWARIRHGNLATSSFVRALFALRTLPSRLVGAQADPLTLRLDDLVSSPEHPGFQVLLEEAPREVAVGAIGKVWKADIPFVHVLSAEAFAAFVEQDYVKVAWSIRVLPCGESDTRVEVEVRVDATDEASWDKFQQYFRLIGPFSHFIRRLLLAELAREFSTPKGHEDERPLVGDALLPDAVAQMTHGITIHATPEAIWPWLVQMGCRRAGYYSVDVLDNAGERSAREIHPELQKLKVGDVIPARPESDEGFEVLRMDAPHTLVLGGLYDVEENKQLVFDTPRPQHFWQVTWAFVLEPLDEKTTRLHVRVRAAFSSGGRLRSVWIRPVHHFMQSAQLRNLAARVEGKLVRDDWHDVVEGVAGAAIAALGLLTPFMRSKRNHWGVDESAAKGHYPGDKLVPEPRMGWTHAVEIDAPAANVWPWIAQIGADRGGFYSYQWLENLVGCQVQNAETLHPEWQVRAGDSLILHPSMPSLRVVEVVPGRHFIAYGGVDEAARAAGKPWVNFSWLFMIEPLTKGRCRLISRVRSAYSEDLGTRLAMGPTFMEPVGFAMDRRMLLGVKERAERGASGP